MLQVQPTVEQHPQRQTLQQQTLQQLLVRPNAGGAQRASLPVQACRVVPWLWLSSSSSCSLLSLSLLPACLPMHRTGQPWGALPRPLLCLALAP